MSRLLPSLGAPRVGDLRDRVDIIADATTDSASGGRKAWSATPTTVATVWAAVQPVNLGREDFGSPDWTVAKVPYAITIRWRSDVTEKMRVRWGSRIFRIAGIPVADRSQEFIRLVCEEVLQ